MSKLQITKANILTPSQKQDILKLWNEEYPLQIAHTDIESLDNYLNSVSEHKHLLLVNENNHVKGWYFEFERNGENWFAMIINSKYRGKGHGSKFLQLAKSEASKLTGWVVDQNIYPKTDGNIYTSPLDFYVKNGFRVIENAKSETDLLSTIKIVWKK